MRFAYDLSQTYPARLIHAAPGLSRSLPSLALSSEGGGREMLDPLVPRERLQSYEPVYQMDFRLARPVEVPAYGARVYVRFSHPETPLAGRIWRAGTRVFLRYFVAKKTSWSDQT